MHEALILINSGGAASPMLLQGAAGRFGTNVDEHRKHGMFFRDPIGGIAREETMNASSVVRFRCAFALVLLSASVAAAAATGSVQDASPAAKATTTMETTMKFPVPEVLREEHAQLHAELEPLVQAGGETGKAAQAVAEVLHVHFVKEEKYALPPLALLSPLAKGELSPDMAAVLPLTEELKRNLPQMLVEHGELQQALVGLGAAGKAEHKPEAVRFAEGLMHHAQTEEQVMYPAAILVGEYLKLRLPAGHEPDATAARESGN